jgi:hypothetical protein
MALGSVVLAVVALAPEGRAAAYGEITTIAHWAENLGAGQGSARIVEVIGVLTDEGVECPALRADGGRLYTLTGDLQGFRPGNRVRVVGTLAEVSFCMQGTTLAVQRIERR